MELAFEASTCLESIVSTSVSILLVVELAFEVVAQEWGSLSLAVSILLVVELAFEAEFDAPEKSYLVGFNPSCSGIGF